MNTTEDVCAVADYQSAGKGMGTNTWESEAGKNLLFSILIHPTWLPVTEQYLMSMAEAIAVVEVVGLGTTIKWPNDIYWQDKKMSGTRIDVNLQGGEIRDMVIGTGINVNQREFYSDAPNPISLFNISKREYDSDELLREILERFEEYVEMLRRGDKDTIVKRYHERLYRREGFYRYADKDGEFEAELLRVHPNGIMTLRRRDGSLSDYEFKEVKFII
ncbi:MAG: biotin--[Prevotella sp.]|nr:biotin--[acetyl-CoA-carboxylase] ligase [Prevotella sp.]MBR4650414.1 biotin--[acetyl-CoA-carboxylase] ligase [Prevotella sp.]